MEVILVMALSLLGRPECVTCEGYTGRGLESCWGHLRVFLVKVTLVRAHTPAG